MAVRFVIGRAGTGKTALCIREIRAEMARDALGGGALLWIVPEQGTFSAERMLLTESGAGMGPPRRGSFRAQVLGFRRLALLIARETGLLASPDGDMAKPMDEIARAVLLEEIVRHEKEKLTVFRAAAERPGFVARLDAMLRELRQHGHSGASLRELADGGLDPVMTRKLLDLAVLLDAWTVELEKSGSWDFEQVMHAAALKAGESPLIAGGADGPARVWVDAFSEMSALEIRLLAALGNHARDVTITLLADPDARAIRDLRHAGDDGLFARPERLHRRMVDEFRRHQVQMGPMLPLRERHRFADPAIAHLEAQLFAERPEAFVGQTSGMGRGEVESSSGAGTPFGPAFENGGRGVVREPPRGRGKRGRAAEQASLFDELLKSESAAPLAASAPSPGLPSGVQASGVEIWECGDPEAEVRAVAREIRALVLGHRAGAPPLRCRQIGVIVPDLEGYHDALRRIFTAHGIPHFIDRRRGIAHHPLVELLRSALAIVAAHWDRDDLMLYLKTGLAGVPREEVSLTENYLIEHGISRVPWESPWTWIAPNEQDDLSDAQVPPAARQRLARANAVRAKVWDDLQEFARQCATREGTPFARALRELLTKLGVEEQLRAWAAGARKDNDTELAQIHEQAGREVLRILELLEGLLAGRTRTLTEFQRLLEGALEQLTLGLIPPTVDQVLISSVARSRVPEMEAVFVLGAVEGQFPKVLEEDPILSDDQRATFNAKAADPIGEGSARRLLEMPFLDYVALTRSRRQLFISQPLADRRGRALAPSRHLARVRDLLGTHVTRRSFANAGAPADQIGTVDDLLAYTAAWARRLIGSGEGGDALMPAIYNRVMSASEPPLAELRAQAWRGIPPATVPRLSEARAARLYPPAAPLRMSISQLERYAACPQQYFAHYTLALRPRAEFQLDVLSMGSLLHDILERVYRRIIAETLSWPHDPGGLRAAISEEVEAAAGALHAELAQQTPGYAKTKARLKRALGIILEADRRRAATSDLYPKVVEMFFGSGSEPRYRAGKLVSLPVLQVRAGQRVVHVNGKIDRVDFNGGDDAVTVIDYKSAVNKSMELARVRHGLSLQLPLYALVMRQFNFAPFAAMYVNLGLYLRRIEDADDAQPPASDEFFQQFKPRGLIDARHADWLDRALQADDGGTTGAGWSAWYKAKFNKDGSITRDCDLLSSDDFNLVLEHVRATIARLATALAAGRIAPDPYRLRRETPCERCDFAALCPFDRAAGTYRDIPKAKRGEDLAAMRQDLLPTAR